jgi:hypothetical protein
MPIKARKQEQLPEQKEFTKSIKLNVAGDYICDVVDTRMNPESERFNESYYFDFKVESGPANVGEEAHVCKYPADAKGGKNKKTGQVFSSKQAREKDEIRIQQWLAACYGLDWDDAGELAEGGKYEGAMEACFTGEDPETRVKGSSPVAGNKILVRCKSNGKKGEDERFYSDIYPLKDGTTASAPKAAAKQAEAASATKKAPPPPPAAKKPSFEAAAEAAGYQPYPGMENQYMVRYEGGEPVETVELADVKAKLGY